MASPQKENGYTPIAHELLAALARINVNGEARQVLDALFRKIYGFQKTSDVISLSQLQEITQLERRNVCRAVARLKEMRLIQTETKKNITRYWINKDWNSWVSKTGDKAVESVWIPKKGQCQDGHSPSKYKVVSKSTPTIDINRYNRKKEKKSYPLSEEKTPPRRKAGKLTSLKDILKEKK